MSFQLGGGRMEEVEGKNHAPLPRRKLINYLYHLMFSPFLLFFCCRSSYFSSLDPLLWIYIVRVGMHFKLKTLKRINVVIAFADMNFLLSNRLRWRPPSHPHELYDCSNGHMFIFYTYLTHVVRITEESIPLVEMQPLIFLKISS